MATDWQKHSGPYLKKALKQAAKTFRSKMKGPTPAQKKRIKELQKKRDQVNAEIRKLKGN